MPNPVVNVLTAWFRSLPWRLRHLAGPYFFVFGLVWSAYALLTVLLRPWALGNWWRIGLPVALGFGACCWLWGPWAELARNYRGEHTRPLPLLLVWLVVTAVGACTYQGLHYRLGEVRDVYHVPELAQPGTAYLFRLHGTFVVGKVSKGRYAAPDISREKGGAQNYYATCYYACPLLANAADTVAHPAAWLAYSYRESLGDNLTRGELNWRYQNFLARCDARLDSLNLNNFAYLVRSERPDFGLDQAIRASRLAPGNEAPQLLLLPVRASFATRGAHSLKWALDCLLIGSTLVVALLLVMPLRPGVAD